MSKKLNYGCYKCLRAFSFEEIKDHMEGDNVESAKCPFCRTQTISTKEIYKNQEGLTELRENKLGPDTKEDLRAYYDTVRKKKSEIRAMKWVGIGSSWSKDFINTSMMMLENDHLLLVDCGSLIFNKLLTEGILDEVKSATILITHLHGDHVGSLVDTMMYLYYKRGIKVDLIFNDNDLMELLTLQGLENTTYHYITNFVGNKNKIKNIDLGIKNVSLYDVRKANHVEELECYSYDFLYGNKVYVVSGDIKEFPNILIDYYDKGILGEAYLDVSVENNNGPHLTLDELKKKCPLGMRRYISCVHLKTKLDCEVVVNSGFSVPDHL